MCEMSVVKVPTPWLKIQVKEYFYFDPVIMLVVFMILICLNFKGLCAMGYYSLFLPVFNPLTGIQCQL